MYAFRPQHRHRRRRYVTTDGRTGRRRSGTATDRIDMSSTQGSGTQEFHAGHVAVIGRPNVGKSTLVNALVGAKVSITSSRPQTTRHRLLGIATFEHGQLLLVDTPGLHREQGKASSAAMHRWMNRAARGA